MLNSFQRFIFSFVNCSYKIPVVMLIRITKAHEFWLLPVTSNPITTREILGCLVYHYYSQKTILVKEF